MQAMVQVSSFIAVPAMLVALCEAAGSSQRRAFAGVKRVLVGGGTPTDAVLKSVRQMLPAASIKLSYAMTEAASSMTFRTLATGVSPIPATSSTHLPAAEALPAAAAVCVGRPAPGVELDVQSTAGLPPGACLLHLHSRQHSSPKLLDFRVITA
jgi:acyl-CoA synthetase (AMP-forming)/AMP-acid ligase II